MKYNPVRIKIPSVMVKEKIVESAFHEFSQHGYFSTNPDTITKPVGVSRVAFYSYFKNKNEVLIYLIKELMDDLSGLMKDKRAHKFWLGAGNVKDFEEPFFYIANTLSSCSGLLTAFVQGMMGDKDLLNLFDQVCKEFVRPFKTKIKSLQKTGQFQGCDAQVIAQIMVITLFMSVFSHSIGIIECSTKQLAKNMATIFYAVLNFDAKIIKNTNNNEPKSEKSRKTRRIILKSAKRAFDTYGYQKVSMAKIAENAGCSRATVYLYYKRKSDILKTLEKESFVLPDTVSKVSSMETKTGSGRKGRVVKNRQPKLTKSQKTRRNILMEAKKALGTHGYFETTIEGIAKKAGYSRSTMYLHFKKKDDIIQSLLQEMIEVINPSNLSPILDNIDTTSIDNLMRINKLVVDVFENYSMVNWALLQGTFYSPELVQNFGELYNQFSLPINKIIDSLKKKGKCKGVNTNVASRIIITGLCYSASMYTAGMIKCSRNELALNLSKFLSGFLNFTPEHEGKAN